MAALVTENLTTLSQNFLNIISECFGIIISNHQGELLFSYYRQSEETIDGLSEDQIQKIREILTPTIEQIQNEYSSQKFGTVVFESERYRIVNCAVFDYIITFVLDINAFVDEIFPHIYLSLEKIVRVYENNNDVQLAIPVIGNMKGKFKDNQNISSGLKFQIKMVLLGEVNVGKTSIVLQFTHHTYNQDYRPTIGLNLINHEFSYLGNNVGLQIWDIAAHKYFRRVRQAYYGGANFGFLVFDLTDKNSFEKVKDWREEVLTFAPNIGLFLVGNKADLTDKRQVSFDEGLELAKNLNCMYIETSALTGENIQDAFYLIACKVLDIAK
jgi:Ras-related protein Rab-1A